MKHPLVCKLTNLRSSVADELVGPSPSIIDAHERRREAGRRRTALGKALVLQLIREFYEETTPSLTADPKGKPSVRLISGKTPPAVSIAHTADIVAAAACGWGVVGIDLERHDNRRDVGKLAAFAFGPAEQAMVRRGGSDAFYRLWTLREAMGKATGEGLSLATDGTDRIAEEPFEGAWLSGDGAWRLAHRLIWPKVSLALAIQIPPGMHLGPWSLGSILWLKDDATITTR